MKIKIPHIVLLGISVSVILPLYVSCKGLNNSCVDNDIDKKIFNLKSGLKDTSRITIGLWGFNNLIEHKNEWVIDDINTINKILGVINNSKEIEYNNKYEMIVQTSFLSTCCWMAFVNNKGKVECIVALCYAGPYLLFYDGRIDNNGNIYIREQSKDEIESWYLSEYGKKDHETIINILKDINYDRMTILSLEEIKWNE